MGRHRDGSVSERDELEEDRKSRSRARGNDDADSPDAGDRKSDGKHRRKRLAEDSSDSDSGEEDRKRSRKHKRKRESRKPRSDDSDSEYSDSEESESSESGTEASESEEERKRRKRREKRKRKEREEEKERKRRRKEKEKKKRKEKEKRKKERKKEKSEIGKRGAVTDLWGKYGIIRETDMWNKRPEFSAWLSEVKQVNLETLPNWEEKQMFKQFMEDHNTATFPSKKYYNLDAYYKRQMLKELKSGKKVQETERTIFNDEELKRQEQMREREKQKEKEVEALKRSMQSGMAQAMKEQALLREEMAYLYKIGNNEAAAAIQRKLEPDPI
ncbi:unnamed protein product [Linum tenue]|uniref:Uncharacterized protein n=1 Tax=Linum tenue TaxID=586396 RepID=A0AAV0LZV6_9ROSI|nr:unnamed protein product [Linum tenue]